MTADGPRQDQADPDLFGGAGYGTANWTVWVVGSLSAANDTV